MHIGVDMLSLSSKNLIDVAILVSGDADLADAVLVAVCETDVPPSIWA